MSQSENKNAVFPDFPCNPPNPSKDLIQERNGTALVIYYWKNMSSY